MAVKKGQRTINIYAFFFSLVVFLFVMQLGSGLFGALMGFRYPSGMLGVTGIISTFAAVSVLTIVFLIASQAGFEVIRRAAADKVITVWYNRIVIGIMLVEAVYVFSLYKNVWFLLPNLLTSAATVYSLVNINRSKAEVVKSSRAWKKAQERKQREEEKKKYMG